MIEVGQLILTLNGEDSPYTVSGKAKGTEQIMGLVLSTTTTEDSVLTLRNPSGNATALTITPLSGGTRPVSYHLLITKILKKADLFRLFIIILYLHINYKKSFF